MPITAPDQVAEELRAAVSAGPVDAARRRRRVEPPPSQLRRLSRLFGDEHLTAGQGFRLRHHHEQRTTPHQGNLIDMDPVILDSARKHQITDDDMLHAYRHPIRVFQLDDLTMLIGADPAARLLEVGVAKADGIEFIVHAMMARAKFLE
jgi:hypothetical protein